MSPGSGVTTPGRARFLQASFVYRDPSSGRAKREICWRLALVGKAMAELWSRRGFPDEPFLLPISVDLRPKGDPGPTFGNMLAFHFARFRPSETVDLAGLTLTLRRQMVEALRDGQIDANAVAMEFLTYRPLSVMLNDLPGTAARETFSFNCADLGDFPGSLEQPFGAPEKALSSGLHYCLPVRPWFAMTDIDLSGRAQLSYSHQVSARPTIDLLPDHLMAGISLLAWCGIHQATRFDLIEESQMTGAALGLGAQLGVELPFSRQQESEADHIGLVLMAKAGYDPATAVDFWQRMLAYSKGKEPPAFLSDHPSSEQRIADIKRELPEAKAAFVAHK